MSRLQSTQCSFTHEVAYQYDLLAPKVLLEDHTPMMTIASGPIPIHFLLSVAQKGTK